jgi:hypothetical protein
MMGKSVMQPVIDPAQPGSEKIYPLLKPVSFMQQFTGCDSWPTIIMTLTKFVSTEHPVVMAM